MYGVSLGDDGAELRPLETWHAEELLAHFDRGRDHIGRFIGFGSRETDVESTRALLKRYADKRTEDSGSLHGIWYEGTLVGGVLFRTFDAATGVCEVGCWLEPAAVGKGLVTRAMHVLIDWAVDVRRMHRVEWHAASGNTASLDVARRLGMKQDGVLRGSHLHKGQRHDIEIWSLLAPEWRTAHSDH
ncbi:MULTISPECIES: GNAT family N-acetyltransferase [unclassified Streptomyces]|uniref:GNAT family N-acetyltransferase n=1 Tax=unclassified Streptomyces TaxID=2593676 RepID=UPI000DD68016|nr:MULTISPECIES: GNAT family protein [unclassified Streptomyces]QZZ30392.1 GNAT family N-acetyltransferase [Streptomyces sp. ST1015]